MGEGLSGLFIQPEEDPVMGRGMAGCKAGDFLSEAVHGEVAGEFNPGAVQIEDKLAKQKGFRLEIIRVGKGQLFEVPDASPMT